MYIACMTAFDFEEGFVQFITQLTCMISSVICLSQSHVGIIALLDEECLRPGAVRKLTV